MFSKNLLLASVSSLVLVLGTLTISAAAPKAEADSQFQMIEQPLPWKIAVTMGGLGLIGLELWWFVWSQPGKRL